jgi:hypothetical protein
VQKEDGHSEVAVLLLMESNAMQAMGCLPESLARGPVPASAPSPQDRRWLSHSMAD